MVFELRFEGNDGENLVHGGTELLAEGTATRKVLKHGYAWCVKVTARGNVSGVE